MKNVQNSTRGLPLKTQLFGGFNKVDVAEYIKNMVEQMETERLELKKDKAQVYELMEKGQAFCTGLTADTQKKADALLQDAQKKADELLAEAGKQVQQLREERELLISQSQYDAKRLASIIVRQQKETAESYDNLLRPIAKLLHAVGGDSDAT